MPAACVHKLSSAHSSVGTRSPRLEIGMEPRNETTRLPLFIHHCETASAIHDGGQRCRSLQRANPRQSEAKLFRAARARSDERGASASVGVRVQGFVAPYNTTQHKDSLLFLSVCWLGSCPCAPGRAGCGVVGTRRGVPPGGVYASSVLCMEAW